eukprot:987127_1
MTTGFDDNIVLGTVKRNETKIDKCINYILEQNTNTPQKAQEEMKTDDTQTYKERIDELLIMVELQKQDIYDVVEKVYANKNGINGFIEDSGEYAMNIDSIYIDNVNKCAMEECACIKREFRDRNIYDNNEKELFKLYWHCESEKSVVIQQFVDQVHINKYHLIDIGFRY